MIRAAPELASRTSLDRGVTLVELLVVIAVLAVLAVGTSLAIGRTANVASDVQRFQTMFRTERNLAIHSQQPRVVVISPQGRRSVRQDENGVWRQSNALERWRDRVTYQPGSFANSLFGREANLVFLPTGQTSSFEITFAVPGQRTFRCRSDGWTGLTCDNG